MGEGMDLVQARQLLDIAAEDDAAAVKRKYRRLMACYHPDAIGSDRPDHIRRAQEINEAYNLLRKNGGAAPGKTEKKAWRGVPNEKAFCDRNIYLYYSMDVPEKQPYYKAARGKYMWDPDEEDFELFLASIHHAVRELLEKTEERVSGSRYEDPCSEEQIFAIQAQLFLCLAMQYVDPVKTLRKIARPRHVDGQGREIYHFRAFLSGKGHDRTAKAVGGLQRGDVIYPKAFHGSKIAVMDQQERPLGYLSLEDDQLYFCVIPLLKKRVARVRMEVKEVEARRKTGAAKAEVDFRLRLEEGAERYKDSGRNLQIAELLGRYEKLLEGGQGYE